MCVCILHSGQFGDGYVYGSMRFLYECSMGDFPVRSCASVRLVPRCNVCSDKLMSGACLLMILFIVLVRMCSCTVCVCMVLIFC